MSRSGRGRGGAAVADLPRHRVSASPTRSQHASLARLIWPVLGELSFAVVVQIIPVLLLGALQYAKFSIPYLLYATANSIQLSVLCDTWAASGASARGRNLEGDRREYYTVLTELSGSSGVVTAAVVLLLAAGPLTATLSALAVGLSVFRSGSRYFQIHARREQRAGLSDLGGATAAGAIAALLLSRGVLDSDGALVVWLIAAATSVLIGSQYGYRRHHGLVRWCRVHGGVIRTYLSEAAMTTAGSVGSPYLILATLGLGGLAVTRAATTVLYPVRLLLAPLRPRIVGSTAALSIRRLLALGLASTALGAAISAALAVVDAFDLWRGSAVHALSPYWGWTGLIAACTAVSVVLQFRGRVLLSAGRLLVTRLIYTVVVLAGPVLAAALGGVAAIVPGMCVATGVGLALWLVMLRRDTREAAPACDPR